ANLVRGGCSGRSAALIGKAASARITSAGIPATAPPPPAASGIAAATAAVRPWGCRTSFGDIPDLQDFLLGVDFDDFPGADELGSTRALILSAFRLGNHRGRHTQQ